MESKKKMSRNSSFELLRIIAIMGVVCLHYNSVTDGAALKWVTPNSLNQYYLYFVEALYICAVNLFVMISAYFLCSTQKRRIEKVLELVIQVSIFRCLFYFVGPMATSDISLSGLLRSLLPVNYFVMLYIALYLVSPYINLLINNLRKEQLKKLIIILVCIFSVWTIAVEILENFTGSALGGLSTVSAFGSQKGYTIVNFILVYFVGAYIKIFGIADSKKKLVINILVLCLAIFGMSVVEIKMGISSVAAWSYNNPLVILMAMFVLALFTKFNFSSAIINELAKGSFTCFLIHSIFLGQFNISQVVNKNIFLVMGHQLFVAVSLYLLSYLAYKIYYFCSHWFFEFIRPICNKLNDVLNENII